MITCELCGKEFKKKRHLRLHYRRKHVDKSEVIRELTELDTDRLFARLECGLVITGIPVVRQKKKAIYCSVLLNLACVMLQLFKHSFRIV